ncbi:allophanate hydrolase subunit 1 [Paenarthrobacter sp. NPDC091711]|uniref:5-oxoprolinase subunit B family protein n=1 Tax=Paenarthrobacter sp. NPDC091711 TaxID=3364385 RepID=UPI0038109DBA
MSELLAQQISIRDCGDSALRLTAAYSDRERNWLTVQALAVWLREYDVPGVRGVVPTYDSLLVEFDPVTTDHQNLRYMISLRLETLDDGMLGNRASGTVFHVPVVFGGEYGPDIESVSEKLALPIRDVIGIVCRSALKIRCLAQAGAPMLDGPGFPSPVARRQDPRTSVPSGSVVVAGIQANVIPTPAPCGWQLLGRTPLTLVDVQNSPILAYRPGDSLKFFPIKEAEWEKYQNTPLGEIDAR